MYSQNNIDFTKYYFNSFPNSPSTATFLRYGDIQNSEFTGTNSPKIPLFVVKEGSIEFPLNLDYISGNGVRVTDESTSVGLGWNIGLPSITQSIMSYDDFDVLDNHPNIKIDYHSQPAPWPVLNYNNKYIETQEKQEPSDYINLPKVGEYTYHYAVNNVLPVDGYFKNINATNTTQYDVSPDIFILNLFGEKVEFIIENFKDIETSNVTPYFVSLNKHGYKITYDKNSLFTITAPNGVKYLFEKAETVTIFGAINRNYVLTKIIDINNNSISINYKEFVNVSNFVPFSKNLNYTIDTNSSSINGSCDGIPIYSGGAYVLATNYNSMVYRPSGQGTDNIGGIVDFPYLSGQKGSFIIPNTSGSYFTKQNYLLVSSITGNFGSLSFNYTDRDDFPTQKLSSITVKSKDTSKAIKTIDFNYSYFNSPANVFTNVDSAGFSDNRLKKRLKLNSLIINGIEKYDFEYNETYPFPAKDSYAVDYWGYSNGGTTNKTYFLNPNSYKNGAYKNIIPLNSNYNDNKKDSDISYCSTGILKKIIYPTKGYSVFDYELNKGTNMFMGFNTETSGKGLRMLRQTNYNTDNSVSNKIEFKYEGGYSTNPLDLIKYKNVSFLYSVESTGDTKAVIYSMNSTNNYSASPLSSGDVVCYAKVEKTELDKNSIAKGKSISLYNINPDAQYYYIDSQQPAGLPSTKSDGIDNGSLLKQIFFNSKNDTIKTVKNNYTVNFSKVYYGTVLSNGGGSLYLCKCYTNGGACPGGGTPDPAMPISLSIVAHFPIFHKESLLNSTETTDFENGKKRITQKNYEYNYFNNVIVENTSHADGSIVGNYTNYAEEEQNYKLKSANMVNIPLRTSISSSINKSLSSILTRYDGNGLNPTAVYQIEKNASAQSPFSRLIATYDFRDDNGNILEYRNSVNIPTTIIWGYNKSQPIAKIEGAYYNDIKSLQVILDAITASDADAIDSSKEGDLLTALSNLRTSSNLSNYLITTYTYDPLIGVTSITSPTGIREIYKYDAVNRLQSVVDMNGKILKEYQYNYKQ